ncbi:carbonic anhydrase [Roseateles sp. LKC17W]|uniref:carbonic anhydrase n=1 Tax=Pelomonas margarita TaxID=3299031 RepID=A0ABW7FK85_9BURK
MKKPLTVAACMLALAAQAQHDAKEPVDVLRQRLAERLATKAETPAAAKPARAAARPPAKATPHAAAAHAHWGYTGEVGPDRWAELSPDNKLCAVGTRQSPIDIRDGIAVELETIAFDYRPSSFSVLDNGHTVQVNVPAGNGLTVMGRRYELVQFHFHRPAEERVSGKQFDMVAHLVHRDAQGRLAVVAVLLERGADDKPQPVLQSVWANLPLEKHEVLPAQGQIDLNQLLPEQRSYYTYMGSLTTPPCSEGVLWMVMRQPVAVTQQQISVFARLYPMNARPLQAGSGRLIKQSQ